MKIEENVLLKDYTSYKTGGPAKYFAMCYSTDDVRQALKYAYDNNLDYEVIGGGSNLLVSDEGYNGLIIATSKLNRYIINYGNKILKCGAGINLADLVYYACSHGLAGMESMAGIPGTLGGAVKMNAGAYNQEIKDTNINAALMDKKGNIVIKSNEEIGYGYRLSPGTNGYIVLWAEFLYSESESSALLEKRKEILEKRKEKQPLHKPSCGSVFKRPEGNYAGTLIEKCSLKGYRIGGAEVSMKHANFILNEDNATSEDIYNLIKYVQETVYNQTGYKLEPEVRMIGFKK
ncbi:MAG: UDP-N-acetylmuramate dehydrogenase [Candidatus Mucispirillum faecigallinarum]|nr:UDP-N-acetylmuramate dehydrogenase [Candidatus Mucispirillum faecigallinarum]